MTSFWKRKKQSSAWLKQPSDVDCLGCAWSSAQIRTKKSTRNERLSRLLPPTQQARSSVARVCSAREPRSMVLKETENASGIKEASSPVPLGLKEAPLAAAAFGRRQRYGLVLAPGWAL